MFRLCRYFPFILDIIVLGLMSGNALKGDAQIANSTNWMSRLPDERRLTDLSIPGAHDAATGDGLRAPAGFGRTQVLTLAEQWDAGVRAFDLRPAVCDTSLHIYHGRFKTTLSFRQALGTLTAKLRAYPKEFAIVLLREETEAESEQERVLWSNKVGEAIAMLGDTAAFLSANMTLGDVRGKILFLSRNRYEGTKAGAFVYGWSHHPDGTTTARLTSANEKTSSRVQVQDFYAPIGHEKKRQKVKAVKHYLDVALEAEEDVWTINFLSGYATAWWGISSVATTAGYKRNAQEVNGVVSNVLTTKGHCRSGLGILFFDFVGCDSVSGSWTHWKPFFTKGNVLLQMIVRSNE